MSESKLKSNDPNYMKVYYNNHKEKFIEYAHKYYIDNKDKFKKHNQAYYKINNERLLEHTKEYIKNNSYYITCGCGSKIMKYGNYRHITSQKHIKYLESLKENSPEHTLS